MQKIMQRDSLQTTLAIKAKDDDDDDDVDDGDGDGNDDDDDLLVGSPPPRHFPRQPM